LRHVVEPSFSFYCYKVTCSFVIVISHFFYEFTPTPPLYTLSLHDALPISSGTLPHARPALCREFLSGLSRSQADAAFRCRLLCRSEEHTSELQSRFDLVCRLLLEKKKNTNKNPTTISKA